MIFTVLYYRNLDPLMVIDDYISAVWNNKYFTAGDFEIICRTTNERILKIVRNNFITLNGTDEIAVIEAVEFSKDEEQGATMKITGKFAQSLLSKRIVWNKTLLNGNVENELRRLINENALNPTDKERQIDSESERQVLTGRVLNVPEEAKAVNDVEIISDTECLNAGTPEKFTAYGTPYGDMFNGAVKETGIMNGVVIATTEAAITETKTNGTTKTIEFRKGGAVRKLYSLTTDTLYNSSVKNGTLKTYVKNFSVYDFFVGLYGREADREAVENNFYFYGYNYWGDYRDWIIFEIKGKIDAPDQILMSSKIKCLTKAEYYAGGLGIACFDGYLWLRVAKQGSEMYKFPFNVSANWEQRLLVYQRIIAPSNSATSVFTADGAKDEIIVKTNTLLTETLTPTNAATGASDNLSTTGVAKLELKQVDAALKHYLYAVAILKELTFFNYLRLGVTAGITDEIILQIIGDNLQTKIEEVLQLYNSGMRARYEKAEKKIYFDFYKGYNRTKGSIQPIIYSESLDNLESYNVVSANAPANVALVYSEKDGEIISGKAGVEAGALRRETYINKNDNIGYLGADYVKQLQEEGKLFLQAFTLAISADIDNRSYIYRRQFYVGDVATIIIKDLNNISYNVRILEVREYNDINGYTIELVLGE